MQPQQPADPSSTQAPVDAAPPEVASEQTEGTEQSPPWWRRMWRGRGEAQGSEDAQEPPAGSQSSNVTLSQEEFDRRVQAETDRREHRRQQQAQEAERRKLRDEDPWAYAEQDRQAEQTAGANLQVANMFAAVGAEFDKYTL